MKTRSKGQISGDVANAQEAEEESSSPDIQSSEEPHEGDDDSEPEEIIKLPWDSGGLVKICSALEARDFAQGRRGEQEFIQIKSSVWEGQNGAQYNGVQWRCTDSKCPCLICVVSDIALETDRCNISSR